MSSDGYASSNSLLKSLHGDRVERQKNRRWEAPEIFDFGAGEPLRLCSVPSMFLGAQFWSSGLAMARALSKGDHDLAGARCLELGAGLGLVGLAAARYLRAQKVVLSDLEEMQPLLQRNIELNDMSGTCEARTLVWGDALPEELESAFDVVLAADVIYPTTGGSLPLLLKTILQLCPTGSSTQLLLAYQPRAREDQTFLNEELLPHFDAVSEPISDLCILPHPVSVQDLFLTPLKHGR